jgi:CRISPR-associated protein Csc3
MTAMDSDHRLLDLMDSARQTADDAGPPPALVEFAPVVDELVTAGWGHITAKSLENEKTDQSMLQHLLGGVDALVQLHRHASAEWFDDDYLRDAIALFTVHDYHKLRIEDMSEAQFDIPLDETTAFVERVELDTYAPSIEPSFFHAAAVALHQYDTRSKGAAVPATFEEYRATLQFADTVAGQPDPSAFAAVGRTDSLRTALGDNYGLVYHEVDYESGMLTNALNEGVATALSDRGYTLFGVYQNGCTYLQTGDEQPLDVTDDLIDDIAVGARDALRTAHPNYQHAENDHIGLKYDNRYRKYEITDREFFFLDPQAVIRGLVSQAAVTAQKTSGIPDAVETAIDTVEAQTALTIPRTARIDALARLVHTVWTDLLPRVDTFDSPYARFDFFANTFLSLDDEVLEALSALAAHNKNHVFGTRRWYAKYVIATALERQYYPNSVDDVVEELTDTLCAAFDRHAPLDTIPETLEPLHDELLTSWLRSVDLNGTPLTTRLPDRAECNAHLDRLTSGTPDDCHRCGARTLAEPADGFQLIGTERGDESVRHLDGSEQRLSGARHTHAYCYGCQLELELRFAHYDAHQSSTTAGDRLYVHVLPDYAYTPLGWHGFRGMFDEFMNLSTVDASTPAHQLLGATGGFDFGVWLDEVLREDSGPDRLLDHTHAFRPATGFGSHAVSRLRNPELSETEELFVTLVAAASAGVRVYISTSPTERVDRTDLDSAVTLSEEFALTEALGEQVSLSELHDVLSTLAATIVLRDAFVADTPELDDDDEQYDPLVFLETAVTTAPLPGTHLLARLARHRSVVDPLLIDAARVLDERALADAFDADHLYTVHSGWAFDFDPASAIDGAQLYALTDELAASVWPLVARTAPDTSVGSFCAPLTAAFDATQRAASPSVLQTDGGETGRPTDELVYNAVVNYARHASLPPGRSFGEKTSVFARRFLDGVFDQLCDGDAALAKRLERPITDAFYVALLERHVARTTGGSQ